MSTITTRAGKGSQLTWTEVDTNFTNLNTDKIQSTNAGSTGQVLTKTAGGAEWATAGAAGTSMAVLTMTNRANVSGTTYRTQFTESADPAGIVTLADTNYRFVLGAGTYTIQSNLVRYQLAENQSSTSHLLYNITSSSNLVASCADSYNLSTSAFIWMYYPKPMTFTLASSTTIEYRFTRSNSFYTEQHLDVFYITKLA